MSPDHGLRAAGPVPARRRAGAAAAGAGAALSGHLVAVAMFYCAGWAAGGYRGNSDDLEAGGRFGVALFSFAGLGVAELALLGICVSVAAVRWRGRPWFAAGLLAGWGVGVVALLAIIAALLYYASQPPYA